MPHKFALHIRVSEETTYIIFKMPMRMLVLLFILHSLNVYCYAALNSSLITSPRQNLNFTEMAAYDGYETEVHTVTTNDGYILTLFRMPPRDNCTENTKPVIFMHGLYLSGDDCIIPGPGVAHCYTYADNCYDVWVGNVRGSYYSRRHTTLNPNEDLKFWNYAIDEIAVGDTPAIIDYVLNSTSAAKVTYVGHAQGVTMLLLLCAKSPEYNAKIEIGIGLSVTAWLNHAKFIAIDVENALSPFLTTLDELGVYVELLARGGFTSSLAQLLCGSTDLSYIPCSVLIFAVLGYNEFQITSEVLPVIAAHAPAGTSSKNFNRWGQIQKNGFTDYDYGSIKNLVVYGSVTPPEIDLSNVTMSWVFVVSENDNVANITDVDTLISKLPNASVSKCVLSNKLWAHLDFIYGKDIPVYITPIVLSLLANGTYQCT